MAGRDPESSAITARATLRSQVAVRAAVPLVAALAAVSCHGDDGSAATTEAPADATTVVTATTAVSSAASSSAPSAASSSGSSSAGSRLQPVDSTEDIQALFPEPFRASDPQQLGDEIRKRLASDLGAATDGPTVTGTTTAAGESAQALLQVRGLQDDVVAGYDLTVILQPDDATGWGIASATTEVLCVGPADPADPTRCS